MTGALRDVGYALPARANCFSLVGHAVGTLVQAQGCWTPSLHLSEQLGKHCVNIFWVLGMETSEVLVELCGDCLGDVPHS